MTDWAYTGKRQPSEHDILRRRSCDECGHHEAAHGRMGCEGTYLSFDGGDGGDCYCKTFIYATGASEHTCMAYPELYKLRTEQPAMMACVEPKGHAGDHHNRLGETWAPARRPRPIERVEEKRGASW